MDMLFLYSGLGGIQDKLISNWIGPAFFIMVAVFALYFIKEQQFRKLLAFVGISIVVGILIFYGSEIFDKDGSLVREGKELVTQVILPISGMDVMSDLFRVVP